MAGTASAGRAAVAAAGAVVGEPVLVGAAVGGNLPFAVALTVVGGFAVQGGISGLLVPRPARADQPATT